MHLRDPKSHYLTGIRDATTACCVLRDDFREALINSIIFRFAFTYCAYDMIRYDTMVISKARITFPQLQVCLQDQAYDVAAAFSP